MMYGNYYVIHCDSPEIDFGGDDPDRPCGSSDKGKGKARAITPTESVDKPEQPHESEHEQPHESEHEQLHGSEHEQLHGSEHEQLHGSEHEQLHGSYSENTRLIMILQ
jgi:hypothetical protein